MGAQPESQIKRFVERLVGPMGPSPLDQALEQAKQALDAGDHAAASNIYAQILRQVPGETAAIAGLVRCLVAAGDLEEARELVDGLDDDALKDADVEGAISALSLAEQAGEADGDTAGLQAQLAQDPSQSPGALRPRHGPPRRRAQRAGHRRADRDHPPGSAGGTTRQRASSFSSCSRLIGHADPLTVAGRRKLSSILFS